MEPALALYYSRGDLAAAQPTIAVYYGVAKQREPSERAQAMASTREFIKQKGRSLPVTAKMLAEAEECKVRGVKSFKDGQLPEALQAFRSAMAKNPKLSQLLSYNSTIYSKLGQHTEAISAADECVRLHPSFSGGWKSKASAQRAARQLREAVATLDAGLQELSGVGEKKMAPLVKLRQQCQNELEQM